MKRLSAPLDVQVVISVGNKISSYTTNDGKERFQNEFISS